MSKMREMNPSKKRYFEYLEKQGKFPREASDDEPGYAHGGYVEDDEPESFDYEMGHAHDYDSSGEPHTDDKFEDEQPMEYMNKGGRAYRMSRGGRVPPSGFARALMKSR